MSAVQLSRLLVRTAHALFTLFAAVVLIDAMPPALLNAGWIVTTAASLVNYVALPLMGLILVHLGAHFSATPQLQTIQARTGRLAAIAALGYLLLPPLLAVLVLSNSHNIERANASARLQLNERSAQLRRAVSDARRPADLQAAMVALKGPRVETAALAQPLGRLKSEVLAGIEAARASYLSQLRGPYDRQNWPVLKGVLRTAIQCLIASAAFAALSWAPATQNTLLERLTHRAAQPAKPAQTPASLLSALRHLPARLMARLELFSQWRQRRELAQRAERRRAKVRQKIRQDMDERLEQARLYRRAAEKRQRLLGRDSDREQPDAGDDNRA